MIRRPPRSTQSRSSAASDVYKRQGQRDPGEGERQGAWRGAEQRPRGHKPLQVLRQPWQMIDIHCHILPGVDDGAAALDDSVAIAEAAVVDGTRTVVATPHGAGWAYTGSLSETQRRVSELQAELTRRG